MANTTYINNVEITNGANTTSYLIEPTLFKVATTENSGATYTTSNLTGFTLLDGVAVQIKFGTTNKNDATISIGGTTAKPIYYNNAAIVANTLKANHIYTLVYDGSYWQVTGDIDTDTWRPIGTGATDAAAGNHGHGNITKDGKMSGSTASGTTTTSHLFLREDGTWAKPAYTNNTNTHRPIKMNGTQILGNNTTALDLVAGSHISLTNNNGAVTITNTLTASDLGLSSALRFVGKTTSTMSESFNGVPAGITNYTTPIIGDVVLDSDNNGEYVCTAVTTVDNITTYTWEWLGAENSFKLVQTAVADPTAASTTSTTFIDTISQDTQGVITATKKTLPTASTSVAGIIKIGTTANDAAKGNHTHNYLANTNKGSKTQPIYITGNAAATCEYMFPIYYDNLTLSNTAPEPGAYCVNGQTNPVTGVTEYGSVLSLPGIGASTKHYAAQLYISSASGGTSPVHAYIRRLTSTPGWSSWTTLLDNKNTYAADSNGNTISVARNTETTLATINGVAVKIKIPASDNTDMYVNVTKAAAAISEGYPLITSTTPTTTATQNTAIASVSMQVKSVDKNKFELLLGNSTNTTTTGGHYGQLALYGPTSAGTVIIAAAGTQWKTATLQAKDGTIAYLDDITTAIGELDSSLPSGSGANKTLTALTITDGKITAATFSDISITRSQISNFSHTHNYAGSSSAGGGATKATITTVTGSTGIKGYITFAGATSGDNGLVAQDSLSIYDTMASNVPTAVQLNIGKSQVKGSITLYSATNEGASGNLVPATITKNTTHTWTLPNASGTIALLTDTVANADAWTYARKVYTDLTNASTDVTINGGASGAAAIGIGIDGTLGVANGGTGVTTSTDIFATYGIEYIVGTQTAATAAWKGTSNSSAIYLGKTIAYKLPYAGTSTGATLTLTLADGTTTVSGNVYAGTVQLTTHYGAGSVLIMIWDGSNWRTNPYYNTNTTPYGIRVYRDTVSESAFNDDYPLLISRSLASAIASTYSNNVYGVINNTDATKIPTYNLYTGELKAPSFTGNLTGDVTGNADTATKLAASKTIWGQNFDGSANVTGNMTDVGPNLKLPADASTDFYFLKSDSKAAAGYFGKLALNTTYANADLTNYVLDVLGAVRIKLPNSSTTSSRKFIITRGNDNLNLSISVSGIQAYNNTTTSNLALQYYGGTLQIGTSDTATATRDMYGQFTFHSTSGFTYGGMETGTTNIDRPIWFMAASNTSTLITGRPVYSSNFKYNPSTNTLSTGAITTTGNITSSGNITATSTITAENYNNGIKVARVQAWNKTGPYNAGWKRVCSLTGYNSYGIGTVYIGGSWSNSEPTLAAFEIAFSQANSSFTRIKQTICAKKEVPDQIRLVYSGTGGKWYFDIHIPERTASNKVGVRYITFVGKLTVSEINDTDDFLDSEPTTATITRELISSKDQPTITVDLTSTTIGSFTGANMTTGVSGTLPIASGGTGVTSFTKDCVIVSDGATTPKLESRGLKVTGATNAAVTVTVNNTNSDLTISPNGTGTMTLSSTSGATTVSTTNGALTVKSTGTGAVAMQATSSGNVTVSSTTGTMTISSTNGNMAIGPTGTGTNTIKTNSGTLTISTTSGNMLLSSGDTIDISSGTSKAISISAGSSISTSSTTTTSLSATTTMTVSGTQGTTINAGSNYAIAFKINSVEKGEFNKNGMFQLNSSVTQSTHTLLVNGKSAFSDTLGFVTSVANTLTETAAIGYNSTDIGFHFRIGASANALTTMILTSTAFYHATTNTGTLGTSTYRWKELYLEAQSTDNSNGIMFYSSTNLKGRIWTNTSGGIGIYGIDNLYFRTSLTDTTKGMQLSTTNLYPSTNDGIDLGSTTNEWKYTYSKKFIVEQHVTMEWNATDQSLDFIFA